MAQGALSAIKVPGGSVPICRVTLCRAGMQAARNATCNQPRPDIRSTAICHVINRIAAMIGSL